MKGKNYGIQKYRPGMTEPELTFNWENYDKDLPEVTLRLS